MTGGQRLMDGLRAVLQGIRGYTGMTRSCIAACGLRRARKSPGGAPGSSLEDAAWLAQRQPLWIAFSELFLDTELMLADLERIAQAMADSGLSTCELHEVYAREVAPVVSANLLTVAGVWSGFDEAWLCAQIVHHLRNRSGWSRFMPEWARTLGLGRTPPQWRWLIRQVQVRRGKPTGPPASGE